MIKRYIVKGHSMEPSLCEGDRLLVSSFFLSLKKGDVVVFDSNGRQLVKRITAAGRNKFVVAGDNINHSSTYTIKRMQVKGKLLMKY